MLTTPAKRFGEILPIRNQRIYQTMAPATKRFDCVIIGSGQAGTPLASALAQSGRKTALIERSHIGGCCVNEGCTPTKTMIASGRAAFLTGRAVDYGIWQTSSMPTYAALRSPLSEEPPAVVGGEPIVPKVDMFKVRQRKRDIVNSFRGGSEARLAKVEGLEVIMGEASFISPTSISVQVAGSGDINVEADTFFINTGERPARPDLQGLNTVLESKLRSRVLDSTTIQELGRVPEKLLVLGGGYIGLEFGQLFQRLGSKVSIVQRGKQLLPREDPEIAKSVKTIVEGEGAEVLLNAHVTSIQMDDAAIFPLALDCDVDGTPMVVEGSHVLFATGRRPNTDMLDLGTAGVEVDDRGHIKVDNTLQTSAPNIYALGDCHGGPAFTHMSYGDFRIIQANLIDKQAPSLTTEDRLVPYTVYMDPQLGHVGLHEAEARKLYPEKDVRTATMPMAYVARALETDETRGVMKAVVDGESGQILGFTCLGMEGGEVMSLVQVAMMGGVPYTKLQQAVFAHPTLAESLNNLWGFLK